jgi:hypothetical protein
MVPILQSLNKVGSIFTFYLNSLFANTVRGIECRNARKASSSISSKASSKQAFEYKQRIFFFGGFPEVVQFLFSSLRFEIQSGNYQQVLFYP